MKELAYGFFNAITYSTEPITVVNFVLHKVKKAGKIFCRLFHQNRNFVTVHPPILLLLQKWADGYHRVRKKNGAQVHC